MVLVAGRVSEREGKMQKKTPFSNELPAYLAELKQIRLLLLNDVPFPVARRMVEKYLRQHPGVVWPDEMAEELGMDYRIVLKVVNKLLNERKVECA